MLVSYSWEWLQLKALLPSFYFLACHIGFVLYARHKPIKSRRENLAYAKYFLILAMMSLLFALMLGIDVLHPNRLLLAILAVIAIGLVYIDGWLTNKAVGGDLAIEANPIMGLLFRKFGIRTVRIGIFALILGLVMYYVVTKEIIPVAFIVVFWLLVDGNNIATWHQIKKVQCLKASVIIGELGVEDIHEL